MSHSEERSPKRQRRSYSPASPTAGPETKPAASQHQSHSLPQTPPPSVHMSPSWQSQSFPAGPHGSTTFPTPPSTAGFLSQHHADRSMEGSEQGQDSNQPTPAAGSDHHRDEDGDAAMNEFREVLGSKRDDSDHRPTNHDRRPTDGRNAVQGLYRVHTEPIEPSRPHASQNVISLYSLELIQASVARRDAQGNKINKLRKSYENKVKALGLEGRSKAEIGSLALQGLLDPGWDMDIGDGTTTWQARSAELPLNQGNIDTLLGKLDGALAFAPGQLPKNEHEVWKGLLGLDDTVAPTTRPPVVNTGVSKPNASGGSHFAANPSSSAAVRPSAPNSPRNVHRPDRANKKRRYDESSYAGYQDAYDDDGYSTGGHDDRRLGGTKRQKRREFSNASSSQSPFNSGMVGVHST